MEAEAHRERPALKRVTSLRMSATQFTRFHVAQTPSTPPPGYSCQLHIRNPPAGPRLSPLLHTLPPHHIKVVLVWWVPWGWQEILRASQLSALCSSCWLAWLQGWVSWWSTHSPPSSGVPWEGGLTRGWGSPEDQPGLHSHPGLSPGPQLCFLVVQEPGPSAASSSFRKPNCSFIF